MEFAGRASPHEQKWYGQNGQNISFSQPNETWCLIRKLGRGNKQQKVAKVDLHK